MYFARWLGMWAEAYHEKLMQLVLAKQNRVIQGWHRYPRYSQRSLGLLWFSSQSATLTLCPSSLTYQQQPAPARTGREQDTHLKSFSCCPPLSFLHRRDFRVAVSNVGDICSTSGRPVIRSSQAASPPLPIRRGMWVFLLPLWLGELPGRPVGWRTQALTACGKSFPKGMHTSFSHGDHPNLSLAESQRDAGYEVSPRNNPPDVRWRGRCYNKTQIIQFLLRKPSLLSKHRTGLSHKSSCCVFCWEREREQCHRSDRDPLVRK